MIKKVLFVSFMFLCTVSFSQGKSIGNLSASPNPFSTSTTISFNSSKEQGVILIIKNVLGKTIFRKKYYTRPGKKSIIFERNNLNSGMYIYAIQSQEGVISKRFVIK